MKKINQNKLSNLKTSFYNFYKKRKVLTILTICLILAISSILTVNYGRYVKNIVTTYFFKTQNFFFNSNKLLYGGKEYVIEPWSGTEDVEIYVAMDSLENELNGATKDVLYSVVCDADSSVKCTIEGNRTCDFGEDGVCRTISAATNMDSYNIVISPNINTQFKEGDRVTVNVKAMSSFPYKKELSATFVLVIGNYGVSYEIEDEKNSPYASSLITNTLPDYKVVETFEFNGTTYNAGTTINENLYQQLGDNKSKCSSARIKLEFDPTLFRMDLSSSVYDENNVEYESVTTDTGTHNYIKSITFDMQPKSSIMVKFYKLNIGEDYSYKVGNGTPKIKFTNLLE